MLFEQTIRRASAHLRAPNAGLHVITLARRRKSRAGHTADRSLGWHDPSMRRRVLIIDDNSAFRAAVRQLLERDGFVVVAEAGDGINGIQEAKTHRPDLVLVDVQLPGVDGFEVAERLSGLELALGVILTSS